MPADYITQVLLAGKSGTDTVPLMVDDEGRIILTLGPWGTYIPDLAWHDGTPSEPFISARWKRIAGIVVCQVMVFVLDCQGAALSSIALPYPCYNLVYGIPAMVIVEGDDPQLGTLTTLQALIYPTSDNTHLQIKTDPPHSAGSYLTYMINMVYEGLT